MKTSARNQLSGKITELISGAVMTEVKMEVSDSVHISALITNEGKEALDFKVGDEISAIVKASAIILTKTQLKATARNNIHGSVVEVIKGAVNSEVKISVGQSQICAIITNDAVEDLEIKKGDSVYAIFKASSVILVA